MLPRRLYRHRRILGLALVLVTGVARVTHAAAVPPEAFSQLRWRLLGPWRAGWATVVAGVPDSAHTFYFGAAGGGVWRTDDAGQTWRGLMQHERSSAIGALAIAPSNPRVLYAGTGQPDSRYDVMAGDGVYRSDDGGETWRHVGLEATQHIGAILVDPRDPQRALVAALGRAFGASPERGVYRTSDGGGHWDPVLQPGDSVGAVDLAWDESRPLVVYAATWQRRMHPWFDYFQPEVGPGSGIWRSDDGGSLWRRLTQDLPATAGRIGIAVAPGSAGRVVYAVVAGAAARGTAPTGGGGLYRSGDGGDHWTLVNPDGSLGSSYFGRVTVAPRDSNTVYVVGQSIRVSHDGGAHFDVLRGSPGGDDYHALWIDPRDPRTMIAGSDQGAAVSLNGGASWSSWYNQPTGQFYRLAADEQFPYHVYSGQQDNGTVEIASRGPYGAIEERDWHPVGGDERDHMVPKWGDPSIVFGSGLGGTVSRFDERTHQSAVISPWPIGSYGQRPTTVRYRYGWITPLAVSAAPPHALYVGAQVLFRSLDDGNHWTVVSPDLTARRDGVPTCGADPEPAAARDCGYGVIASIAPSPIDARRIWVGTDDGRMRLTTDGGAHWSDVTPPAVPAWGIVFTIDPSPLDAATAYAAVDLHRLGRRAPLLLRTHDSGRSWQVITGGLPQDEITSVVRCDPVAKGLLFAGTDRAVYVSFDDGDAWQELSNGLPSTWMRDLLPHDGDLIVATQGRGIWVLDDVASLREARDAGQRAIQLFTPATATRLRASVSHDTPWPPETALGENPPAGVILDYWLRTAPRGPVTLTITDAAGAVVRRCSSADPPETLATIPYFERAWVGQPAGLAATPGAHRFVWDLRYPRPPALNFHYTIAAVRTAGTPLEPRGAFVLPGRYTVMLSSEGVSTSRPLTVRLDPRARVTTTALRRQLDVTLACDSSLARSAGAVRAMRQQRDRAAKGSALADSLTALVDGESGLASVCATLARLHEGIQAADAAPSQGMSDALADCGRRAEALLRRWRALTVSGASR